MKKLGSRLVTFGILLVICGAALQSESVRRSFWKAVPTGTPFVAGSWEVPPFTENDNRVAPLLWSIKFHIPKKRGCVSDAVGKMYVSPGTVVFIRFAEETAGEVRVGAGSERRTIKNTGEWLAARFVLPNKASRMDIPVTRREQFVICDATDNMVMHFEARRLPAEK